MIKVIIYILLSAHVLCSLLLTFFVLMQRPKSEGLGTAFGSAVTDSLFGAGTSDVLTKMTISLGAFFFGVTLLLAILYAHPSGNSQLQKELIAPSAETAPSVPATPATSPEPVAPAPAQ
ncbi:MAG: preprotein translocase subunit SecG [Verrucomicrobiota bacterium]